MMRRGWLVGERYSSKLVLMWICWLISTDLIIDTGSRSLRAGLELRFQRVGMRGWKVLLCG